MSNMPNCPTCGFALEQMKDSGIKAGVIVIACPYNHYHMATNPDGSHQEYFSIELDCGPNESIKVDVENKVEMIKHRRSFIRKESSVLSIDDWVLHSYDFVVPLGTTNLVQLEKQKGSTPIQPKIPPAPKPGDPGWIWCLEPSSDVDCEIYPAALQLQQPIDAGVKQS